MDFDVIVIGSGPAGCAAAITCKKAGLETLIVTNKNYNADTLNNELQPSESVHPGIEVLLSQLNTSYCLKMASRGVYDGIQTGDNYLSLGKDNSGTWIGNHIDRSIFDTELLRYAINQAIATITNDPIIDLIFEDGWIKGIKTYSGIEITCKYIVDASGYKRITGKKLNLKEDFFSPPLITWTGVSEAIIGAKTFLENRFTKFIPNSTGWTWLAPELYNRYSWTCLAIRGRQKLHQPIELEGFSLIGKIKAANRQWRIFRPLVKEGVILCGDAGGIIDPSAGQGILNAIMSGIKAAETIISILNVPEYESFLLAEYDHWFYQNYLDKVHTLRAYYDKLGIQVFQ